MLFIDLISILSRGSALVRYALKLETCFVVDSPAVMEWVAYSDVSIECDCNQIPYRYATSHYHEEEAEKTEVFAGAEIGAQVESQMIRQGEADENIRNGQGQHEMVRDNAP